MRATRQQLGGPLGPPWDAQGRFIKGFIGLPMVNMGPCLGGAPLHTLRAPPVARVLLRLVIVAVNLIRLDAQRNRNPSVQSCIVVPPVRP